jgi:hypothetical protein
MGTYMYSVRRSGSVRLRLPDGSETVAHPLRYLCKPHTGWHDEYRRRDELVIGNAVRAWEGHELPKYVFMDDEPRKVGEFYPLYRWDGAETWLDCYPMKGEHVGYVRFVACGARMRPEFCSTQSGLIDHYKQSAMQALEGRLAVNGVRGEALEVACNKVVQWLLERSIPPMAKVDPWFSAAERVLREELEAGKASGVAAVPHPAAF